MSSVLASLSEALAAAVNNAGPAVVRVDARRRVPASGIVWSTDGVIATANHVVRHEDNIAVGLAGGQAARAVLVGRDPSTDVAVLRVQETDMPVADRAADGYQVGHLALALGRPGRTVQATLGIISALGDKWRTGMGGQIDRFLQTDVVMYPGFSGGPLVDAAGRVLGLNTSALMRGASLTIPVPTIDRIVEAILAHGRMRRAYLGVSTQAVRLPAAIQQELDQETGLLIVSVEPDSPADQGGLVLGDSMVALDDVPVRHHDDLLARLTGDQVGQKVSIRIVRGGELHSRDVVLGERA
jgi:S1-C subfamily serine protease